MTIEFALTLVQMAEVYQLSIAGGVKSDRFRSYQRLAGDRVPIYGYNPMTKLPAAEAVDMRLEIDAEQVASDAANQAAAQLGFADNVTMHITVAAPGMWTDKLGTEIEHRLKASNPAGILLWFDGGDTPESIASAAAAQVVRPPMPWDTPDSVLVKA